jgi:phosphopantothenoylcysteine decarboxylase/phosphopantothenate--cysteine ligase
MLKGKHVILGITGSIAAYKMANLASMLKKLHCEVTVIMTKNATNFIHPITFEALTNKKCLVDTFDRNFEYHVEHISLAKSADIVLIAPATANVIGKLAGGIADDMLTTTFMACTCKKIIAPAMNTNMYHNPIMKDNLKKLSSYGYEIIPAANGYLACGDTGDGKMPSEEVLLSYLMKEIAFEKDLAGLNLLVTAGPTQERIDPVRFISNHSSGKMGYAIAENAMLRGANFTLVTGKTSLTPPPFVNVIPILSASEMFEAVKDNYVNQDIIIKAAAVADYTPYETSDQKIKKKDSEMFLSLQRTTDILAYLGENRQSHQFLCGFSMETENMIENSKQKLLKKKLDMIVANNLKQSGAGFETDTNVLTLITTSEVMELPLMSKQEAARQLLDTIKEQRA